jgi:hypothetical protein
LGLKGISFIMIRLVLFFSAILRSVSPPLVRESPQAARRRFWGVFASWLVRFYDVSRERESGGTSATLGGFGVFIVRINVFLWQLFQVIFCSPSDFPILPCSHVFYVPQRFPLVHELSGSSSFSSHLVDPHLFCWSPFNFSGWWDEFDFLIS